MTAGGGKNPGGPKTHPSPTQTSPPQFTPLWELITPRRYSTTPFSADSSTSPSPPRGPGIRCSNSSPRGYSRDRSATGESPAEFSERIDQRQFPGLLSALGH